MQEVFAVLSPERIALEGLEWLSNAVDPNQPGWEKAIAYSLDAQDKGEAGIAREREQYLNWLRSHTLGPPKATTNWNVEELLDMCLIGVYRKPEAARAL
jgi:hypothetical protein